LNKEYLERFRVMLFSGYDVLAMLRRDRCSSIPIISKAMFFLKLLVLSCMKITQNYNELPSVKTFGILLAWKALVASLPHSDLANGNAIQVEFS
jgi:hypothetical protein